MSLKWTDVLEIAIQLDESKPEVDPRYVNFVDLRRWVVELPEFSDDPQRSGEKVWRPSRPPGSRNGTSHRPALRIAGNPRIIRGFYFR